MLFALQLVLNIVILSAVCLRTVNLHLNHIRPYTTICSFFTYLYRLQLKNDKFFFQCYVYLWHEIFVLSRWEETYFFFPCVQLVIYDLYEQGIVIVLVFIDVLVTVAAIVPRLSCKTHRIYYKALCSDSTDSRLSKSWTEFFPLPNRRALSYIQHEE